MFLETCQLKTVVNYLHVQYQDQIHDCFCVQCCANKDQFLSSLATALLRPFVLVYNTHKVCPMYTFFAIFAFDLICK